MAIFSLLECFVSFHKLPISERSIAVRGAYFSFFSFHFFFDELNIIKDRQARRTAMDRSNMVIYEMLQNTPEG